MSSVMSRVISGSAAAWSKIGITMFAQIALVPLYLSFWSVETYGVWLEIQALVSLLTMINLGHHTFLGYEFLRFGRRNLMELSRYLWSGIGCSIVIGIVQIIIILIILYTGALPFLLGKADLNEARLIETAGIVFIVQGVATLLTTSLGGLFVRALDPFGYFSRLSWWGVLISLFTNFSPAIAVVLGADFLTTGIVIASATVILNIPVHVDMIYLMRKENIKFTNPSFSLGAKNFLRSIALTGKLILDNARQQGVRLLITPLVGASALAAFSTMRTGSNIALQGLNTVTNPLKPDLMRFLHEKDQIRSDAAFSTVWIVVVAIMSPAVVILQAFIAPIFSAWTKQQIPFDPVLFSILSLSVLVYAVAQPAMAVVVGNNLIMPQLLLSVLAAFVLVAGIIVLVPWIGLIGAGIALLTAELVASVGYTFFANQWLNRNLLAWPGRSFRTASTSVWIAGLSMALMIWLPQMKWALLIVTLVLLYWNLHRYWKMLPALATQRVIDFISKLPAIKRLSFYIKTQNK